MTGNNQGSTPEPVGEVQSDHSKPLEVAIYLYQFVI